MSAMLEAFHFLRPWWGLLSLVWLPLAVVMWRADRHGSKWRRMVDATLLPHLLTGSGKSRHGAVWLLTATGLLVTLALAGPTWQRLPQPLYGGGAAQVVVVSLSPRMWARDVAPDRMARVRYKVRDLLDANAAGRNALVAYAGEAFVVAPLTTDAHSLDNLLDALSPDVMPVSGDAPAKGIRQGVKLLRQSGIQGGSLVVVTDHVDEKAIDAARKARTEGVRVSVLGVGATKGVPVTLPQGGLLTAPDGHVVMARQDAKSLEALAEAGGGVYAAMQTDHTDIKALQAQLRAAHHPDTASLAQSDQWRDMGPWLLLPVVLLAALAFRRGWLLMLPLLFVPMVSLPAHAADRGPAAAGSVTPPDATTTGATRPDSHDWWSSLWFNADQRADRALQAGHPEEAQRLARSPAKRGAAAYRAGDYAASAKAFAHAGSADAAYNRGNALAREGKYHQAIKAYDKALALNDALADARANRKAVEDWLRQHQSKPPPQKQRRQGRSSASKKSSGQDGKQQQGKGSKSDRSHAKKPNPASSSTAPQPAHAGTQSEPARSSSGAPAAATSVGAGPRAEKAPDAKTAAQQQAEARRARKALRKKTGKRKGQAGKHSDQGFDLGRLPAPSTSVDPLPKPMQRALQRVPDDPGGLLKRKFELEYRQRRQGNGGGS